MMIENAVSDRIIVSYPLAFLSEASPYTEMDFDVRVKNVCEADRSIRIGLKISKTIFVGDVAVGKTCLVNRFCHEVFNSNYKATIGVDFEVERFDILNTPFNLQIWDTAGQERFKSIAAAYYRGAQAVVIVFDITNMFSLQNVPVWLKETLENNRENPVIFLIGTKRDAVSDATYRAVEQQAVIMARSLKAEYWAVSSKTGENVKEFFFRLAALCFNYSVLREIEVPQKSEISSDFVKLSHAEDLFEKKRKKRCSGKCA